MTTPMAPQRPALVYRQAAFTVPAFDRLKDWQRHLERIEGRRVTNNEALDRLILAFPAPPTP